MPDLFKSKVLDIPGNAKADPAFYEDDPTAKRSGPLDDNGNLGFDGFAPQKKDPNPFTTGGR